LWAPGEPCSVPSAGVEPRAQLMRVQEKRERRGGCLGAVARLTARLALVGVVTAWAVETVWGETTWLTALITYIPPLAFLGLALIAGALGWIARERQALVTALLALAVALGTVARPSIHRHEGLTRTMESVRIVTWNVHNRADELPAIRARLDALTPDIVCLQEAYDRRFREALPGAQPAKLGELVTLSRLKLVRAGPTQRLPYNKNVRMPLEVQVETRTGRLSVLNVHLFSYRPLPGSGLWSRSIRRHIVQAIGFRNEGLDLIEQWLGERQGLKVVAGDFNTPPQGRLHARAAGRLQDSFAAAGNGYGWSFPREFPLWRIDYVWLSEGLRALNSRTVSCPPSDHCLVVMDVQLPRAAGSP
jgi:vancomycin resistance protein VanJ